MSDGVFPDRLTQLRNRWESDPSSRIFLQLAEEYRHQGRVKEALDVLERGLKEHPGYLSALVAKGRCLLELGEPEPAREVLERVVKQDATQMVANKLLVRAYLETGDPERARERLDLYSLLNDSDPEIEELRRRLHAMEQPPQAEKTAAPPGPAPAVPPPADDDIFGLGQPAPPPRPAENVFDLDFAPPPVAKAAPVQADDPFADLLAPPPARPAVAPAPAAAALEETEAEDVLFPGLASRDSRQRYMSALAAEGLFAFEADAAPAPPAPVAAPVFEDSVFQLEAAPVVSSAAPVTEPPPPVFDEPAPVQGFWQPEPQPVPAVEDEPTWAPDAPTMVWERREEAAAFAPPPPVEEAPVFEIEERTPWPAEPEPLAAVAPQEPLFEVDEAPASEPAATATLGEIYLRQGHLREAERMFQEVLQREPDNASALEGLERLAERRRERRPVEARELMAGYEPGPEGGEAEARARKAYLLNSYLQRLRRGGEADVS